MYYCFRNGKPCTRKLQALRTHGRPSMQTQGTQHHAAHGALVGPCTAAAGLGAAAFQGQAGSAPFGGGAARLALLNAPAQSKEVLGMRLRACLTTSCCPMETCCMEGCPWTLQHWPAPLACRGSWCMLAPA